MHAMALLASSHCCQLVPKDANPACGSILCRLTSVLPTHSWIYEHLFGPDATANRRERELVEDGVIEVDGPPPEGTRDYWRRGELEGDLEQLRGHRWG